MENAQAGAPEKPEIRPDTQEEAHEGDTNESPLQVPSSNVALRVPEVLNTAQAKGKKGFLPVASNTLHLSIEESEFPQKDSDVPKFPENITHHKKGKISGSSAKTTQPKHSNTPNSLVKTTHPKQGNTPKSSEETIQSKEYNTPTSSEETTQAKEGNTAKFSKTTNQFNPGNILKTSEKISQFNPGKILKASEKTNEFNPGNIPKASEKTNQFNPGRILRASEKTNEFNPGHTLKASANTIQSKHSNIPKSLTRNTQPKQESIPKSLESKIQSREGDIPKPSEETAQPREDKIPKSSEETKEPKEGDIPKPSEETPEPKEDAKEESVELPEEDMVKVIMGKDDFKEALKEAGEKLVAVDFSATWCGPCRTIRPLFHLLSLKHNDVVFLEVDVDDCEELVKECEVICLPTFHFYQNEEKVGELCGAHNEKLEAIITELK
ncbi:thioredoxin domain-containing protein 2 [Octodon degus]|uniref:Thioredoxin domain-containing protein 2 n=1 Tax=Octodon degus TaxID=10160 RepID=A0A6P3VE39_OCTDE|nr:thioredoxin domain-containing protein 2 [Octodon degus]